MKLRRSWFVSTAIVAGVLVASLSACSGSSKGTTFPQGAGGKNNTGQGGQGAGGSGQGAGGIIVGQGGNAGSPVTGAGGSSAGGSNPNCSGLTCSGDLSSVVDCNGNVQTKCTNGQACAAGSNGTAQCTDACTAAAAIHGTLGCDFLIPTPAIYPGTPQACFAAFMANNSSSPVNIKLSYAGQSLDATQFGRIAQPGTQPSSWAPIPSTGVPTGQVAVIFLSQDPNSQLTVGLGQVSKLTCPITPAINKTDGTSLPGSGSNLTGNNVGIEKAFHISTDQPVTAYDIMPFGGAASYIPSAELLYPTTSWATNYLALIPKRGAMDPTNPSTTSFAQVAQIVAAQDNTMVQIQPTNNLPSGPNVSAANRGMVTTYMMNAGDVIQWEDSGEISGTVIQSNNPISFWGGEACTFYQSATSTGPACDSAHQQIPPISAFGSEYAVAPYPSRMSNGQPESIPYRILGAVDGTVLTYDPPIPSTSTNVPPTNINGGGGGDFEAVGGFVVKSQDNNHPFYLAQLMTGCDNMQMVTTGCSPNSSGIAGGCCPGDPEFMNVLPPAQFLTKYTFFTDPTYGTTDLVFVRVKGQQGFSDVSLDCAGTLSGWVPLGSSGNYEMTPVNLVSNLQGNGMCNNGPHTATSMGQFGVTVWGLDSYSSYGYPAGGNAIAINSVVVPVKVN